MKYLSFLVAVGILVSAVSAAPTNTDIQQEEYNGQSTKVQDWNNVLHYLHGALGSYLNSGGKEAAEVERMTDVAELMEDDREAELQGLFSKRFLKIGKKYAKKYGKKYGKKLAKEIIKHYYNHGEDSQVEQESYNKNLLAAIEALPEEAQTQLWGTLGALALNHFLG